MNANLFGGLIQKKQKLVIISNMLINILSKKIHLLQIYLKIILKQQLKNLEKIEF